MTMANPASFPGATEAYVWVWPPNQGDPVVAGRLRADVAIITFTYARSYLERADATPLYLPELPLGRGPIQPAGPLVLAGCIRDAGPDAWGQRVILAARLERIGPHDDPSQIGQLDYLLESGSNRVGAFDFQASPVTYVPRSRPATLEELHHAAGVVDAGESLAPDLVAALQHGTSIGGARPKAVLTDHHTGAHIIAKFATSADTYPIVKAEAVAMELARLVGVNAAPSRLVTVGGRAVLLVDRFDRIPLPAPRTAPGIRSSRVARRAVVSALTLFGLDEMTGRYGTYHDLTDIIRARFTQPRETLRELFNRIAFNICVSNTDDHARNHSAFYTYDPGGVDLTLTPAYDLCPQPRTGESASQAMAITRDGRRASRLRLCVLAAPLFQLTASEATDLIDAQITTIERSWPDAADAAQLTNAERALLWRRLILHPAIHYDVE